MRIHKRTPLGVSTEPMKPVSEVAFRAGDAYSAADVQVRNRADSTTNI